MEALRDHRRRPLTVDVVLKLAEEGWFDDGEPCELLWGELHTVSPQSHPHAKTLRRLRRFLEQQFPDKMLSSQMPLVVSDISLPEPDILVCRFGWDEAPERHPNGDEALMVVEVTYTTHERDRAKAELYAAAGIPTYWLVDVANRYVEVYSRPLPDGRYGKVDIHPWTTDIALPEERGWARLADIMA